MIRNGTGNGMVFYFLHNWSWLPRKSLWTRYEGQMLGQFFSNDNCAWNKPLVTDWLATPYLFWFVQIIFSQTIKHWTWFCLILVNGSTVSGCFNSSTRSVSVVFTLRPVLNDHHNDAHFCNFCFFVSDLICPYPKKLLECGSKLIFRGILSTYKSYNNHWLRSIRCLVELQNFHGQFNIPV